MSWNKTKSCDKIAYNLSQIREDYVTYKEGVKNNNKDQDDEWIAGCTVAHYGEWTRTKLIEALDWPNWAYYKTIYKWELAVGRGLDMLDRKRGLAGSKLIGRSMCISATRNAKPEKQDKLN